MERLFIHRHSDAPSTVVTVVTLTVVNTSTVVTVVTPSAVVTVVIPQPSQW